ncbi:MAG: xanthine dehydrogenase family protein molybdopterin-binding subunit [Clostridiales Family XIII bacterium]|nr:xanthine dehydrogenase family protein molybdopterin-binding subunit [Clostridiales Family XIII bacterium]
MTKTMYEPRVKRTYVGAYRPKIDAREKTLGKVRFFQDVALGGMFPNTVYGGILRSPYANATIVGMDTSDAEALPGVRAVLRYDDPEIRALKPTTHAWTDTAITPFHRDTIPRFFDRTFLPGSAKHVGDQMGVAVAADSPELVRKALGLVEIEWDVHPVFLEAEEAVSAEANDLHPGLCVEKNKIKLHGDFQDDVSFETGDIEKAKSEADVAAHTDMVYGGNVSHGTLDFRGLLIKWDSDRIDCWTNHYYTDQTRMYLHEYLDVPINRIRVVNGHCGAHMGKWNMGEDGYYVVMAFLARRSGKPVYYRMDVHEEFHDTRNLTRFVVDLYAKNDGEITGMEIEGIGTMGGYYGPMEYNVQFIVEESAERIFAPIKNLRMRSKAYFTNRVPGGVMRGIGNLQLCWPLLQAVDIIAEKLGIDPVDVIKKNFGDKWSPYPNESLAAVLDKGAELIGWERRRKTGEGELIDGCRKRGFGVAVWNQWHAEWQENARGRIEVAFRVNPDLSVTLISPTCETGAGGNSACVFACADSLSFLNITPEDIHWVPVNDSDSGLKDCPPTDSIVSFLMPEAMPECAAKVKEEFRRRGALMLDAEPDELDVDDAKVFVKSDPSRFVTCWSVMMDVDCVPIYAHVVRNNNKTVTGLPCGAWFAEVEVDIETGEIDVRHVVLVNDVGQVMHASGAESQQLGAQELGVGEALTEDLQYDRRTGTVLNRNYLDYKMLTSADFPEISPCLMEVWKGAGEYGAAGIAEAALTGTPTAIGNAVYNAIGVRFDTLPITPKKVLDALEEKERQTGRGERQ